MGAPEQRSAKLDELDRRIRAAREARAPKRGKAGDKFTAAGMAWRMTLELVVGGKSERRKSQTMQKGYAEEAKAFLEACRTGEAPVALSSLIETTLVTLLAVEDLAGRWDQTLELGD